MTWRKPKPERLFASCPMCGDQTVVRLNPHWLAAIHAGAPVPLVACGGRFHYVGLVITATGGFTSLGVLTPPKGYS